jgi:predicted nucleic acid-binding protein
MAEVVLDANIIIAQSDRSDALHARAIDLVARLERDGHRPVLIDVLVAEAISVLCRRARERKANPPGLGVILDGFRLAADAGEMVDGRGGTENTKRARWERGVERLGRKSRRRRLV